eukprot:2614072-Amphidinium_carterae.1
MIWEYFTKAIHDVPIPGKAHETKQAIQVPGRLTVAIARVAPALQAAVPVILALDFSTFETTVKAKLEVEHGRHNPSFTAKGFVDRLVEWL